MQPKVTKLYRFVSGRWHELDLIQESRWGKVLESPPSRAIMYTAQDASGRTNLQLYSPHQNTCSLNFKLDHRVQTTTIYSPTLATTHGML